MQQYEIVWPFHEGHAGVCQNGKWGFANSDMRLVIPCQYDEVKHFSNGLACVRQSGIWGYIDTEGIETIPYRYNEAYDFKSCGAIVREGKFYGVIDRDGRMKAPFCFEIIEPFLDGYSKTKMDGKYGVMACAGDIVVECEYKRIMQINPIYNTCIVKTFADSIEMITI